MKIAGKDPLGNVKGVSVNENGDLKSHLTDSDIAYNPTADALKTEKTWNNYKIIALPDLINIGANGGVGILGGDWIGDPDIAGAVKATLFFKADKVFDLTYQMAPESGLSSFYQTSALYSNQPSGEYFKTIDVNGGDIRFRIVNKDTTTVMAVTKMFVRLQF